MIQNTSPDVMFQIIETYTNYFKAFLKRADILNGTAGSYHLNQDPNGPLPFENWMNLGELLTTTGVCVSMSQAIINDQIFNILLQSRGAQAKLVSIDIQERFYGYCKPSYGQNKWHTAIMIEDSGILFILDATCAQFGNDYVGKLIWNLNTWLSTFRSALDIHTITDFKGNEIDAVSGRSLRLNSELDLKQFEYNLKDFISLDDTERKVIGDFFLNGANVLNRKIETGNLGLKDFQYMSDINNILKKFPLVNLKDQYALLRFDTKELAKKYIRNFITENFMLPGYLFVSDSVKNACSLLEVSPEDVNVETSSDITYILLHWKDITMPSMENIGLYCSGILPYGTVNLCTPQTDIYNGGKSLETDTYGVPKQTNCIFIDIASV